MSASNVSQEAAGSAERWRPVAAALVLAFNAAIWVAGAELATLALAGQLRPLGALLLVCLVFAYGLVVALGLGAISFALARIARRWPTRGPGWIAWLGAAIVAAPAAFLLVLLLPEIGAPLLVVAAGIAACVALGRLVFGLLAPAGAPWLAACVLAAAFAAWGFGGGEVLSRVDPSGFGLHLLYCLAVALLTPAVAALVLRVFDHCLGRPRSLPLAVATLLVGTIVGYWLLDQLPIFEGAVRRYVIALALLLVLHGMTRVGVLRVPRIAAGALLLALGGASYLHFAGAGSAAPSFGLSTGSVLTGEIIKDTGVFEASFKQLRTRMVARPEFAEGRRAHQRAREWNAWPRQAPAVRYSVLLLTIDALRTDAFGALREPALDPDESPSPNIDRLVAQAHHFENGYAQGGWTSISVPAILWSRYPRALAFVPIYEDRQFRMYFENEINEKTRIRKRFQSPLQEPSHNVAEVLGAHGFQTVAATNDGYTHYFEPRLGFARGFGEVVYPSQQVKRYPKRRPLDEVAADVAIERLGQLADERFLIWTHFFGPHSPHRPPRKSDTVLEGYDGEIEFVDRQVGRVLEALEHAGRAHDTIVIITGDHGESFKEHRFKYHGMELYEESMRVPILVRVPGEEPRVFEEEVGLIDVAPTILDYAGVPIPEAMQGFSLRRMVEDPDAPPHPPVYLETWRNSLKTPTRNWNLSGVVHQRWKLILDRLGRSFSLYDLAADPGERENLLERSHPESEERLFRLGGYLMGWEDAFRVGP